MLPHSVSDIRSNLPENIVTAATIVGKGAHRRAVFEAIYFGKKKWKTVAEIARATGLPRVRVLQEGGRLAGNQIVEQGRAGGDTAYAKDPVLSHHKKKILDAAMDVKKRKRIPTKQNPRSSTVLRVVHSTSRPRPRKITIDDVASFKGVSNFDRPDPKLRLNRIPEERIKTAFKRIIGETHDFKDWGGEKNDLFTNKLRVSIARTTAVFAFKGKATQGSLTPRKMGKNGDQIARLFGSEAYVFFVVYHGKVDQSIHEQMHAHAIARSYGGRSVHYGVIDGDDLNRLFQAYPAAFAARP
jgi:hypothetical protein